MSFTVVGGADILTPVCLSTMRRSLLLFLERRFVPDLEKVGTAFSSSESDEGGLGMDSWLEELGRRTGRLGMENGIVVKDDDDS